MAVIETDDFVAMKGLVNPKQINVTRLLDMIAIENVLI